MKPDRRGFLGILGAAPLFGNAIAESVGASAGMGAQQLGLNSAAGQFVGTSPSKPRMEHSNALRMIFGDAEALAEIRDELFAEQRHCTTIDLDILVMKAWSPMAKITFQRQRNVERAMAELQAQPRYDRPGRFLHSLNERLNKLMWPS